MGLFARVAHPDNGYDHDKKMVAQLIQKEGTVAYLPVKKIKVGRSSTEVVLEDYSGTWNSVNFEFYISGGGSMIHYDIFADPQERPEIERAYLPLRALVEGVE